VKHIVSRPDLITVNRLKRLCCLMFSACGESHEYLFLATLSRFLAALFNIIYAITVAMPKQADFVRKAPSAL